MDLDKVVDLATYPIHQPDTSAFASKTAELRDQLKNHGIALLPNFMTSDAIEKTIKNLEASSVVPYRGVSIHNVYLESQASDESLESDQSDHPRKRLIRSRKTCYTHDQVDTSSPLNRLYCSDQMTDFIRVVIGKDKLYRTADPLGALNVQKYLVGDELGWHFDRGEFAVTLLLQAGEEGGLFEFFPSLRNDDNPNYEKVQEILLASQEGKDLGPFGIQRASRHWLPP